ncbi:MAG TPA: ATP-dependent DNA ligase [Candidatus Lustribacter sp.]|nr:ATP-dependent DNA ligase [Candidatus Lustribacter sp.]
MLLREVVEVSAVVGSTPSRLAKVAALADLLARLDPEDVEPVVGFLLGRARQGRVGVGWAAVSSADRPAADVSTLTVADVDGLVTELAGISGAGSGEAVAAALGRVLARATEQEQQFVARVLLGDLRTGALEGVLTDAAARAAGVRADILRRAVMLSGDLGGTVRLALAAGIGELEAVSLCVGTAVFPMLASTAVDPATALARTGAASVEYKLDGARIQVHREGEDVRIFTRNLADITHRLPELVEIVRRLPVDHVILDGETLTLDEDGDPRPFQETISRFSADAPREALLRPWFFDVLHVDGVDLIDRPLSERLVVLDRVVGEYRVPGELTDDPRVAERVSVEALAAGHEGIVVKGLDSAYAAGRRGTSWLKVKPVHTYDLVVLAAEWGSGRRTGWLSNLHLGARDPLGDFGEPGGYVMVGKTFKGLTDDLLRWQTERFPQLETHRSRYAVHLEPRIVVEIAIDGVQRSRRYPGGIALRFARVKRYREDKPAVEADTITALRALLP